MILCLIFREFGALGFVDHVDHTFGLGFLERAHHAVGILSQRNISGLTNTKLYALAH